MSTRRPDGADRDARLRKLVQHAYDVITVVDRAYHVTFASPSIERVLGYTEEELRHFSIVELVHPDDRDAMVARGEALLRSPGVTNGPNLMRLRHRNGAWVWLETHSTNLFDDPDVLGIAGLARDVSDRIRAEREVAERARREETIARASRRMLEASFDEAIRDVSAWVGEIMRVDTLRLFEVTEGSDLLQPIHEWRAPGIAPNEARMTPFALVAGNPLREAVRMTTEPGVLRIDDVGALPAEGVSGRGRLQSGGTKAAIGVASSSRGRVLVVLVGGMCHATRAWTDEDARMLSIAGELIAIGKARRQAEVSLQEAKDAAEAANRSKSTFLAHVSHELRTPLNGVIGMVDLLAKTLLGERQRRYVEMARSSADLLLSVVNDVLDFSKIEANKLELERAPFRLGDTLEDAVASLSASAAEKGLDLVCKLAPGLAVMVAGDSMRLRQIVVNLVGNAVKFTERGEVVVTGALLESEPDHLAVRIEVADTGIGLSSEQRLRLFAPFSQSEVSTARRFGGSGLGLAICRMLVERLGGEIGVTSELGRGSTFHFTARFERSAEELDPALAPAALSGLEALVVDDSELHRAAVVAHLASLGMICETASDGPSAILALQDARRAFDVLVLDLEMPGMDGLAVARLVRASPALAALPIVALDSIGKAFDRGAPSGVRFDGYAGKPVRRVELVRVVAGAVRGAEEPRGRVPGAADPGRAGPSPRHALLVEDGDVNAEVVIGILASTGHTHDRVSSGRAALEAIASRPYDLVLMDCFLPDTSGLEVTRAVRRMEAAGRLPGRGAEPLPIIALTADVTVDNQRACAEAGMTSFLSKPVDARRLLAMVEQQPRPARAADPMGPVADIDAALARLQGNRALLARVVTEFMGGIDGLAQKLRAVVAARDPPAVAFECHRLGSQVATFDANRAGAVIRALRAAAGEGDWMLAERWLAELEQELSSLRKVLTAAVRPGS
jgi:PAS domain S-box-containing protein